MTIPGAIEPTVALFLDGEVLDRLCKQDLTLAHDLFQVMVRRLRVSRAKLIEALKPKSALAKPGA